MTVKGTKEYRAQFALNNQTICSVRGSDQNAVRDTVQAFVLNQPNLSVSMKGKALRFEESQQSPSQFIYHESFHNGQEAIGSLAEYEVPETLGVKQITDRWQQKAA